MSEEYSNANFIKFDVDESPDIAMELNVTAMPTFFLFKNGQKVDELVGANPSALKTVVQKNI